MRKLIFGLAVCAGLFWACSNDDVVTTGGGTDNVLSGEGVAYLTVRIKDVNSSSTRATDGGFAYGTTDEQAVNNAYFYLYDENDDYVAYGSLGNVSGTAQGTAGETTTDATIEWESATVVAIWGLTDPSVPTKMVTVLNQPSTFSGVNKDLATLKKELAGTAWGDTTNGFVMSTSVYMRSGAVVDYTTLTAADFSLEPIDITTDYPNGGVDVYVERLAAKVGVNVDSTITTLATNTYAVSSNVLANFPMGAPTSETQAGSIAIEVLGFDVDAVARDAYMLKHIDTDWNFTGFSWNSGDNYRSYWAESPNYGITHEYPGSSLGYTADDEEGTGLDQYLRYVDLKSPTAIGGTTYCGENTNTAGTTGVITATDNTGLTNILVKAQVIDYDPNGINTKGIDLVEYHGEYYTAADFCQKCVDDVVAYDFTVLVDDVIQYLKNDDRFSTLSSYLDDLNAAIYHDNIFKTPVSNSANLTAEDVTPFGGEMLSLYNAFDGNVKIYYRDAAAYWGQDGNGQQVDEAMEARYPEEDIVYGGTKLGDYDFWFHVDYDKFSLVEGIGLQAAELLKQIGEEWYMPIDNSIYFTTEQGHVYTTRNYLLRAITEECDAIDTEFGSLYPNYYKDGLMYYYAPIDHLNNTTGSDLLEAEYGVVRNHWYNVTITSLEGLGRGIAVEDEVIVPQPEVTYYYLGTDVNILSWKMINSTVGW